MGDCMTFPATFEEFAEEYKIVDSKEVYTNGTELIPIFRVKQWLEDRPINDKEVVGEWLKVKDRGIFGKEYYRCSNCKSRNGLNISFNYCFNCGAKMNKK